MQLISYIFLAMTFLALIWFWLSAFQAYGGGAFRFAVQMWRLQSRSWCGIFMSWSLYFSLFYVLKETIWTSLDNILPPIPLCFVLAVVIAFVGYGCLPPTILFLGASQPPQRTLAVELARALRPQRIVFLLSDDISVGIYNHDDFSRDNLRTPNDVDWRDVVHPLIDLVAVVIIDTRALTPPVGEEISRLATTDSLENTLFVVGDHGESPALQRVLKDRQANLSLRMVSANDVVPLARKAIRPTNKTVIRIPFIVLLASEALSLPSILIRVAFAAAIAGVFALFRVALQHHGDPDFAPNHTMLGACFVNAMSVGVAFGVIASLLDAVLSKMRTYRRSTASAADRRRRKLGFPTRFTLARAEEDLCDTRMILFTLAIAAAYVGLRISSETIARGGTYWHHWFQN